jgi:hypothetical protein
MISSATTFVEIKRNCLVSLNPSSSISVAETGLNRARRFLYRSQYDICRISDSLVLETAICMMASPAHRGISLNWEKRIRTENGKKSAY